MNTSTGAFLTSDTISPSREWGGTIDRQISGLMISGTNFIGTQTNFNDSCYDVWRMTDGSHQGRQCADYWGGNGISGSQAGTLSPSGLILSAAWGEIGQYDSRGDLVGSKFNLDDTTLEIKGMEFGSQTLYMAAIDSDGANAVFKASLPHGITVTTNPRGIASSGTSTVWVLVDAQPYDKVLPNKKRTDTRS